MGRMLPSAGIAPSNRPTFLLSPVLISNSGGRSMSWSYLPRWKFTDSCGRPRVPGAIHLGCTHDGHTECAHTTRRTFLKGGVAIVGGAGLATVIDPREVLAQVRVFPPPPPAVRPIAGLMDTH